MKISGNGIEVSQQGSMSAETSPLNDPSRLPVSVIPSHYKLHFDFNVPQSFSYTGSLEISLEVSEASEVIWIHALGLSLSDAVFEYEGDKSSLEASQTQSNPEKGIARLIFPNSLSGRGKLSMNFSGRIKRETSLNGIYENPYVNASGDVSSGICTLFAATEARSAFPCFDEPSLKATFELSIRCPAHFQTVLSNMPEKDIKREGEFNTHVFDQTPRMSTYLLCMILGSYDVLSSTFGDTLISVYTPLKRSEQGKYPLKVALKCMEFFSTYFDVPYSLPKLDLIAVSRLSVGAMENWGLITYRESGLLVDESHTAPSHQQKIASLVSHEISHQWFGNLVTMSWWSDLWLNEGLATLFQYIGIQDLFSDYPSIPDQFVVNTSVPALRQDALESSHPIRVPIRESSEISSAFDRITYCKGAAVLCMLHNYLGKDTFREGIRVYVKKYSYGNAETEDLWACLSQAAQVDVESIMREWTLVKGYPLVRVSLLESNSIVLSQVPFTSHESKGEEMTWSIPLTLQAYSPKTGLVSKSLLLDSKETEVHLESLDLSDPGSYVQVNPEFSGFFRTAYSEQLSEALSSNVAGIPSPVGRLCLIDDRVSMIMAEGGSTVRLLQMISSLRDSETSFVVWQNICGFLFVLRNFFEDDSSESQIFDRFCIYIMEPCLEKIKSVQLVSSNHHPDAMLYSALIGQVGTRGHAKVHEEVAKALTKHMDGRTMIPAALRSSYFKIGASSAVVTMSQMLTLYRNTDLIEEKNRLLNAMGCFKDPEDLSKVLDFSLSHEVQPQESLVAICSICTNKHGYRLVWEFFTSNFDKFVDRYGQGLFLMERLLKTVTESFSTEEDLRKVREFFTLKKSSLKGYERNISQAEETIRLNITLKNRDLSGVKTFLYEWNRSRTH